MSAPISEDDYRQLSELQHFAFCRRQWALIHLEQQWAENILTAQGALLHDRAHADQPLEARGDLLIARSMRVASHGLHAVGVCDVVEFHRSAQGIPLHGREGLWLPVPVEYKHGKPKPFDADELQLCGQAMCLEEMLCCEISTGSLYYGTPHQRTSVAFTPHLRERVTALLQEMEQLAARGHTPRAVPDKKCRACSLREACLPQLERTESAAAYLAARAKEDV